MKSLVLAAMLSVVTLFGCATPSERGQLAFAATGTVVTVVGFVIVGSAIVTFAPVLDEAAVALDEQSPGLLRGPNAGPTCSVSQTPSMLGGPGARFISCAPDACDEWADPALRADCMAARKQLGIVVVR